LALQEKDRTISTNHVHPISHSATGCSGYNSPQVKGRMHDKRTHEKLISLAPIHDNYILEVDIIMAMPQYTAGNQYLI